MVFEGIFKRILRGTDNSQDYRFEPDFSDDNFIKIYLKKEDEKTKIEDDFDSDVFILTSLTNLDISDDKFYFYISYDNVYELYFNNGQEIDDYKTLNLPEIYKGYIYIENLGNYIIDQKVIYSFKFKDGTNLDIKRVKNNILDVNGKLNLMPKNMYQLAKILANYNSTAQQNSDINEQFSLLKVIKDYSEFTNVLLHKKLTDEEKPILIDKIKLDFKDSGDVLEIFPVIENQDEAFNEEFLSKFDKADKIRNFYNVRHNGKDIRVIVKHKDSAEKIKRNRFLSGDEKVKFLKGDNEIFQDENFDLSLYGPRVKGIGYLTYRANESPRNIIDGSWFELPQIFTEDEPIILEPQDREVLKQSLEKLQKEKLEYVEVELHKNNKPIKLILSEEEIILEIEKINNSIKKVEDINNLEELKEIKELAKEWEEYIPYKGNYIEYEGQEAIDKQIAKVEKEGKPGKETLLIKENEENEEYVEEPEYLSREVEVKIPNSLKVALFEHQVEGLKKLQNLYIASSINSSRNGFLLADDMGLGKTLQILSFLAYLKETNELGKVLVVAPSTLLKNWDNVDGTGEIQKFFTRNLFKTLHIQGVIKKHEEKKFNYLINNSDIVFITYDSLRLNNIFMGKIKWNVMICDEIQMAKNPKTLLSIALKAQNANFKVACSATPIENSLLDLWNIVDFAMPGRLGSMKNFKQCYMNTQEKDDLKEKEK
ncbi:MAG: hypothetical protein PWQ59_1930, partial [Thermoanaerobacterium sp.]|nr:hypothetical protein [Thermoanaerobacterium sp.]